MLGGKDNHDDVIVMLGGMRWSGLSGSAADTGAIATGSVIKCNGTGMYWALDTSETS